MKRIVLTAAILIGLAAPAGAGFDEGVAAYARGDYPTALREFRLLAKQGDDRAQYNLGIMYDKGAGVPQDYAEAVKWYRKAAEQGNARAQNNVGLLYANGLGVPQDYAEAVRWYRKAAEQGEASTQFNLGLMYDKGRGVPQDYSEAVRWYRKAAEKGSADAQNSVGLLYAKGLGVPQDYAEAVRWFRKAAEQGIADAQNNLGVLYHKGAGGLQDYAEAVKWYRKAAEQGNAGAQHNIGLLYANGLGVPQDYVLAHMWFNLAAAQGEVKALKARDLIAKRTTPADISKAQKLARVWLEKNRKKPEGVGVFSKNGFIFLRLKERNKQLTHSGRDHSPVLSPDQTFVVYSRQSDTRIVAGACCEGEPPKANQLWMINIDGTGERLLVRERDTGDPEVTISQFDSKRFSSGGRYLYFKTPAWVTSDAIHRYDFKRGEVQFFTSGNQFSVLSECANTKYRDHVMVNQHRYFVFGGSYDWDWLYTPEGKKLGPLGKSEGRNLSSLVRLACERS